MTDLLFKDECYKIVGAAIRVRKTLGYGFLEKVYENALGLELLGEGFRVEQQKPVRVFHNGTIVGDSIADFIVNSEILLELKSAKSLTEEHQAQVQNYLAATRMRLGILLNFGPNGLDHKRLVH